MQRKLLAVAVAGAFALPGAALAQVTISGQMRFSLDHTSLNDGSPTNLTAGLVGPGISKWSLTGHSANIKFTSRESLGGGMTAWGIVESGVGEARTTGQSGLWNGRNSGVGLDTSWGTVMLGMWDSPYKQLDGIWSIGTPAAYSPSPTGSIFGNADTTGGMPNPNCVNVDGAVPAATAAATSACVNVPGSATAFQRRLNNTFQYWSPVWNGVQVLFGTQANEEKANSYKAAHGTSDPSMWAVGLRWTGPRWALALGHERHKNFNVANTAAGQATPANVTAGTALRTSKDTGTKFAGNYNFGPVQASLGFERLRYQLGTISVPLDRRERNWSFGLAAPIGNGVIRGQYSRGKVTGSAITALQTAAANVAAGLGGANAD